MCLSAAISIAGTAFSAIGAIQQGRQAAATGKYQAEQAIADAEAARAHAQLEAAAVRKEGQRTQSAARASMAASGVSVDVGTAELINRDIVVRSEEDALARVMDGDLTGRKFNAQAQAYSIGGNNARTTSALKAGGAVASGWKSFYKGE